MVHLEAEATGSGYPGDLTKQSVRALLVLVGRKIKYMRSPIDEFFLESNKQTRVVVSVAALGLVLFFLAAAFFPFKDQLFNLLYPKPSSRAQEGANLTINGINAANNMATLEGFDFFWNTGSIGLSDGAYAVLFVTTKDEAGNILDQHWLVGSHATEGLNFNGSYTFPQVGTATITVIETNNVDCSGFGCNPTLAVHNSSVFTIPGPTPTPTPTATPTPIPTLVPTPTPSPTNPPSQNYGSITGTVYSSSGGIVAGAKITTKVDKTNKTYYSNSLGVYSISNLPPGTYYLNFSAKNYFNKAISVQVSSGLTSSGNITLTKK